MLNNHNIIIVVLTIQTIQLITKKRIATSSVSQSVKRKNLAWLLTLGREDSERINYKFNLLVFCMHARKGKRTLFECWLPDQLALCKKLSRWILELLGTGSIYYFLMWLLKSWLVQNELISISLKGTNQVLTLLYSLLLTRPKVFKW